MSGIPQGWTDDIPQAEIARWLSAAPPEVPLASLGADLIFKPSLTVSDGITFALARIGTRPALLIESRMPPAAFTGIAAERGPARVLFCPMTPENASALREHLPYTRPSPLGSAEVTFGVGDRLGIAGPAMARLFPGYAASPVLAQQSVRELTLMGRTFSEVLDAATWAVFREGFRMPWGADGDHLKDGAWVARVLADGYTMVTADVSDHLRLEFASRGTREITAEYGALDQGYRADIERLYLDRSFPLDCGQRVALTRSELERTAVMYSGGVAHAAALYRTAVGIRPEGAFDFELSIDETASPTTPAAHLFVARECARNGVRLSSLAPRFVGEFQKGIDYIGDPHAFNLDLEVHASLARLGGYRLSIHSGSDKYAVFPSIGKLTRGRFHIKTSGTSWLEALRLMSRLQPVLFRRYYSAAVERFGIAQKYYHVTPDLDRLPRMTGLSDTELPSLLDQVSPRQVLHVSYGEVLKDAPMRDAVFSFLASNEVAYHGIVGANIERHLASLGVPKT